MSKRHLRYVVRYRHPRRIKPRLVVEYPPLVRPTLMRKCLRVLSLVAAALFVGLTLALTHSHEMDRYIPIPVMGAISFVDAGTWALDVTDPGAVPCAIPAGAGHPARLCIRGHLLMAYEIQRLGQAMMGTGSTAIYTANNSAIMWDAMLTNVNSVAAGITLWAGSAATEAEALLTTVSIPPSSFLHWTGRQFLATAHTIKGQCNLASSINVTVTGIVMT